MLSIISIQLAVLILFHLFRNKDVIVKLKPQSNITPERRVIDQMELLSKCKEEFNNVCLKHQWVYRPGVYNLQFASYAEKGDFDAKCTEIYNPEGINYMDYLNACDIIMERTNGTETFTLRGPNHDIL